SCARRRPTGSRAWRKGSRPPGQGGGRGPGGWARPGGEIGRGRADTPGGRGLGRDLGRNPRRRRGRPRRPSGRHVVRDREPARARADRDPQYGGGRHVVSELSRGRDRRRPPHRPWRRESLMPSAAPIVTVDGPSGSGKGTISRGLASRLRWHLLDSGALYRLVALAAARRGNPGDPEEVAPSARSLDASFGSVGGAEQVML